MTPVDSRAPRRRFMTYSGIGASGGFRRSRAKQASRPNWFEIRGQRAYAMLCRAAFQLRALFNWLNDMVTASDKELMNVGLYTPAEAAFYARVHTSTMTRWVHGNRIGKPVLRAQRKDDPDKTVTFLDFVQALAIRAIRRDYKMPLEKIRKAVTHMRDRYGIPYPFAMRGHKTYFFGNEIHIELAGAPDTKRRLVQVSGSGKDQLAFREIAELYMEQLEFTAKGLAASYRAYEHGGLEIIMDPTRRLGQPFIKSCHYGVQVLMDAYRAEGGVNAAALAYGVQPKEIELAIRWSDYLAGSTAA